MERPSIQLELAPAEASVLLESIGSLLSEMHDEIARTDDPDYRAGLCARLDRLQTIQERLARSVS